MGDQATPSPKAEAKAIIAEMTAMTLVLMKLNLLARVGVINPDNYSDPQIGAKVRELLDSSDKVLLSVGMITEEETSAANSQPKKIACPHCNDTGYQRGGIRCLCGAGS